MVVGGSNRYWYKALQFKMSVWGLYKSSQYDISASQTSGALSAPVKNPKETTRRECLQYENAL